MRSSARPPARVLFVLKFREQPYGADGYCGWGDGGAGDRPLSSGLFNSASFMAQMLAAAGVATKLVHVRDGNDIHRELVAFGATHVIIEAFWCPPYKFDDLFRACPAVRFIVRNHSETPFLASEGMAFGWTLDYLERPNVVVAPNAPRMLADTRFLAWSDNPGWSDEKVLAKVPYLPNFYPVDQVRRHPRKRPDAFLDVGCFGAIRPLKNTIVQAIGALTYARRVGKILRFHVNGLRVEMGGAPIVKNLQAIFDHLPDVELMCHEWRDADAFRGLVARMDVVSQVSFSETFNIVAADAVSQGVPIVASAEIPWSIRPCRADPTDARSIADAMGRVLGRRPFWPIDTNHAALRRYSAASRERWLDYFAPGAC